MNLYKRCNLCNLLLDIPAHWFAHLHIMLGVANFVKMALRINNLCALWEYFHLDSSDNGRFLVQFSQLYREKANNRLSLPATRNFIIIFLFHRNLCRFS